MKKIIWKTEKRKIKDLIPYEKNPRKLTDKQKIDLVESLEKFNLVEIPAINTDNVIIAGHQRLKTMIVLGRGEEITDVRVPDRKLNKKEFDEYLLRSNKNTGEWDNGLLAEMDEALLKMVGFESSELDKILKEKVEDDDFDIEENIENSTGNGIERGDIFLLGENRLMCGSATVEDDVNKLMNNKKSSMVFTDPPYNVNYKGGMGTHAKNKRKGIMNDKMSNAAFREFLSQSVMNLFAHTEGAIYICMSSTELDTLKSVFVENGGHFQSFIIWVKNTFTLSRSDWQNQYEPILYGWPQKVKKHYFDGFRDEGNVWEGLEVLKPKYTGEKTLIKLGSYHLELEGKVEGKICKKKDCVDIWPVKKPTRSSEHPTMKPIKLVAKAIKASSKRGQIVLDTFMGSGSTLIASEQTKRICYGMELDPKFIEVIINRWESLTGGQAEKE